MKIKIIVFSIILSFLIPACKIKETKDGESVICTTEYVPGIIIEVFDKQTGEAISCGATALIQEGSFSETLNNPVNQYCSDQSPLQGAHERPGTYNIIVSQDGYQDLFFTGQQVTANVCHVNSIKLQAYLER